MLKADIPAEPADGSVVLDCETVAWQRRENLWHPAQSGTHTNCRCVSGHTSLSHRLRPLPWIDLILHRGPLAPMIAESAIEDYLEAS